jgi:tetratricopeptide (TPR) repeat protein
VGLSRKRLMAYIDTLNWSGDHAYAAKRFLDAEEFYNSAIKAYTDALDKKRIEVSGRFGEIYANLADIYYYDRAQYETAFSFYQEAEQNEYTTPETAYKRGFIKYREAAYKDALVFFYQASGDFTVTDNLLLSLANTLYYRMDYSAASGYYLQLRNAMRDEIDRALYKEPQDRPDESRLVRLLMSASNNLGVSLYYLANRGGDASRRAEAMASFTESLRLYDVMNRDQSTMLRPQGANLAFLNLDGILHPSRLFVPQIYPDISRDLVDSDEKIARDAALYVGKER